jgi:hypothetical protein
MKNVIALLTGSLLFLALLMPGGTEMVAYADNDGEGVVTTGGAIVVDPPAPAPAPAPEPDPPAPAPAPQPFIPVPEPDPFVPDPMPGPVIPVVSYIALTPGRSTIDVDMAQDYHATAYFTDGSTQDVTGDTIFVAGDSTIAQVHNGTSVVYGVGTGTTTIVGRYQGFRDTSSLTVRGMVGKSSLVLSPHSAQTIKIGAGVSIKATLKSTSNPPTMDVTSISSWDYDANIVTMTYPGYFVGKTPGETIVKATYTSASGDSYTDYVEVDVFGNAPVAQRIEVKPGTNSGYLGQSIAYYATLIYSDGTRKDVTNQCSWVARDTKIAASQGNGRFNLSRVGTTYIDAYYNSSIGSLQDASRLTVYANSYDTLSITPAKQSTSVGSSVYYQAVLIHNDGRPSEDVTRYTTWSTGDSSVARSQGNGTFLAAGAGTVSITATYSGSTGVLNSSANLSVNAIPAPPAPHSPQNSTFTIGSTLFYIDGVANYAPLAPYTFSNRTYVPLRAMASAIGVNVGWNNTNQTATFVDPQTGTVVALTANSPYYSVNGFLQPRMDVSPRLVNGSLTCPARYLAQAFGYSVGFNSSTNTIVLARSY